jgi:hypothetical protein
MYTLGESRVETQRYERQCSGCRRWFWAWEPARTHCYFCQPLSRAELTSFKAALESGNGHGTAASHKPGAVVVLKPRVRPADAMGGAGVEPMGTAYATAS